MPKVLAGLVRRAGRIVFAPGAEWEAVRAEAPTWRASLIGHALPLAILPALAWATGLALHPDQDPRILGGAHGFAISFAQTFALTLLSIGLLALGFYLLSPCYELRRDWDRAAAVSAYGSTPVLLAGALLVVPLLAIVSMVSLLHCFFLYYAGVTRLLGCKPSEAAAFVATACIFAVVASVPLGVLGSAAGLL